MSTDTLLQVRDLKVHFPLGGGLLRAKRSVKAVDGVSFDIARGSTFGIVGESGSGKSTTALAVMRLVDITAGSVHLGGSNIGALQGDALRRERRRFQMVFQDPYASLNPRKRAGDAILDALNLMDVGAAADRPALAEQLFVQTGLKAEQMQLFPHQFSGGQRQRVAIARALAMRPDALVCDEPVASLDVSIQAQIINLFLKLRRELKLTMLFISHDLSVVRHVSDRVAIMYLGRIVEIGQTEDIFNAPRHPYTRALLDSAPRLAQDGSPAQDIHPIQGELPSPINPPPGCAFHQRCAFAQARCHHELPQLHASGNEREVACHFPLET